MRRRTLAGSLCLLLAIAPAGAQGTQAQDADLALGISQAREGHFDLAVLTLDTVARRLKAQGSPVQDLALTHVFLSMAHLGLGRQTDARSSAAEALRLDPQLQLTAGEFPPRLVALFDEERRTMSSSQRVTWAPAPPSGVAGGSPAAPPKKDDSHVGLWLWLGVGVAAAGGGAAVMLDHDASPTVVGTWHGTSAGRCAGSCGDTWQLEDLVFSGNGTVVCTQYQGCMRSARGSYSLSGETISMDLQWPGLADHRSGVVHGTTMTLSSTVSDCGPLVFVKQ